MSVTPNRITRFVVDVPEVQMVRPPSRFARSARSIATTKSAVSGTMADIARPGPLILRPVLENSTKRVESAQASSIIPASSMNLATGYTGVNLYRSPSDLTGVSVAGSVVSSGVSGVRKRVAAGDSHAVSLSTDPFPAPSADFTAHVPTSRVALTTSAYPQNAGFALELGVATQAIPDTIARLYFGGPTENVPYTSQGGAFCVSLKGDAKAILYEYNGSSWVERTRIAWDLKELSGGDIQSTLLQVVPYATDSLVISGQGTLPAVGTKATTGLFSILSKALALTNYPAATHFVYTHNAPDTGFTKLKSMTGAGPVRIDIRDDLRTQFCLYQLKYPASATITDTPFHLDYFLPVGTDVGVKILAHLPPDTSVSWQMIHEPTATACSTSPSGGFFSKAGLQNYYIKITLLSSADGVQTPVVYGYEVSVAGATQSRTPTAVYGGNITSIDIQGVSSDPTTESATLTIEDVYNEYSSLRTRSRQRAGVWVYDSTGTTLRSIIFDGEIAQPRRTPMYTAAHPFTAWSNYNVSLTGMWRRLSDTLALDFASFYNDSSVTLPDGSNPPWLITDIIKFLFAKAGFPESQLNIATIDLRLWATKQLTDDMVLQPTATIADIIQHFVRDYLGGYIVWNPNRGSTGQWELLYAPAQSAAIASFVVYQSGKLGMYTPDGGTTAEIVHQTYVEEIVAPECNYVKVVGAGGGVSSSPNLVGSEIYNPISFDFNGVATSDPTSIDYLGRFVPLLYVDNLIATVAEANFIARRIYDVAAHGQRWASFTAPLLLLSAAQTGDASQTRERILRCGDRVSVLGSQFLIISCDPIIDDHDSIQLGHYEGYYL